MNPILDIIRSGGVRVVATLAAEAVGTVPAVPRAGRRSIQSLAIAAIRRAYPELTQGAGGYEVARNVWRRAFRAAASVVRDRDRGETGAGGPGSGGPTRPPRRRSDTMGQYVYRVEFVSRAGVSRWRTVTYRGPAGMSDDGLRAVAQSRIFDGPDESRRQRYDRGYIAASAEARSVVVLTFTPDV